MSAGLVDKNTKFMWKRIIENQPPKNMIVMTKVDDELGVRNEQKLKFDGKLWYTNDGSMYVYHTPTHWRYTI